MQLTEKEFYQYLFEHPELLSDRANLEKIVKIRKMVQNQTQQIKYNNGQANNQEKGIALTKTLASFKQNSLEDKKNDAAFASVLMLGLMSFVTEIMFIMISYLIFK